MKEQNESPVSSDQIVAEPVRTEPLKTISLPIERVDRTPVAFENKQLGLRLAGILFRPAGRKDGERLRAVIVCGPMYSTKELPQSNYAIMLAEQGYATLVYDNSYIGSSEGHPRGYEDPDVKASDLHAAVDYLESLDFIDKSRIAAIGICGSGSYVPYGAKDDARIKAVVSIVPFTIMDTIVTATDEELLRDKEAFEKTGEVRRIDLTAGSPGEAYYLNAKRGATPNYVCTPSWSQLSWHKFHPTEFIHKLRQPYLVIVAEKGFSRPGGMKMYENSTSARKRLHITKEATHFEMYDGDTYVRENVGEILNFLKEEL